MLESVALEASVSARGLRLDLLGGFSARLDGGRPIVLPARKAQALLVYLAQSPGRWHSREKLTAFLWGDAREVQARQAFRQTLSRLRRALPDRGQGLLRERPEGLALEPAAVSVDAVDFASAVTAGTLADLERAAELYRGDFLEGFVLDEAPFEEWRLVERERLHELALEALTRLLREHLRGERIEPAVQAAMRILAMDPLQEAVHRVLMRLLVRQGRRAVALQQYQACVSSLHRELGAEPEEETRQLYREILQATHAALGRQAPAPGSAAGTRAVDTPMIARESELERLRLALSHVLDAGGQVTLISGEAGIGKSRLIQEFAASEALRPCWLSFGRCHETEQTLPFRPWIEALRGDGGALDVAVRDRLGASTRRQLAALFPELAPAGEASATTVAPALLFEPLLELVGALASDQPVVIVLEDLHWADTMSTQLLAFLGRRIHRWPILVVGSTRPEELVDAPALAKTLKELRDDGRLAEVALGPLSETEGRTLVRALRSSPRLGRDWEQVERDVWTASEGNPFVIVESMRSLQQEPARPWAPGATLGRRVQDVVTARLERLADLPRHCVAVAATIGRDFPFVLLARASGVDEREAADAVEQLVRRRILDSVGDRLDFCHDWIRRVAYEGLLPARRRLHHLAIGQALEALHRERPDDVADQLGHHYSKAGDVGRAIPHLMRFGQLAAQRYALDDAYRALAQARTEVDQLPPPERDRPRLQVALQQAFVLSILGRQREILELLEAHADAMQRVPDATLASEYCFRLGLTYFFLGQRGQAQRAAEEALAHGERVGSPEAIGKALHVLSLQRCEMGRPAEGIAHAVRAIGLLDRPHTQAWLGLVYQDLALNCLVAGDLPAALAANTRVVAIARDAQLPRLLPFAGYVDAWVHALRGMPDLAIEIAQGALALSRDATVAGLISGSLGQAYLERGDASAAESVLTRAVDELANSPVRHAWVRSLALLSEAHLCAGDRERARKVAARALDLARADDTPLNIGLAQRALGRIADADGDPEAAAASLADALETFARCEAAFEVARTRVYLAGVDATRGKTNAAREHLLAAVATFEAAAAPRKVAAARALSRSLGIALEAAGA